MAKGKSKLVQGEYTPQNPSKYGGKYPIEYRSSWEFNMMNVFDRHPDVISWASESITIPYKNPLTRQWSMYVPDFMVVFKDKSGKQRCEMLEVKPAKEHPNFRGKVSKQTKLIQAINAAKWAAAATFCAKNKIFFRVLTENDMFN